MAADWLRKIFVPENAPTPVGTPESAESIGGMAGAPGKAGPPENQAGMPPPGAEENGEGQGMDGEAGQSPASPGNVPPQAVPSPPPPQEQYHYAAFDEDNESTLWNQHTRIVLAIFIAMLSACFMWWILV